MKLTILQMLEIIQTRNGESMPKYRCKYEYNREFGQPSHLWSVVGELGAMHLSIRAYELDKKTNWCGGLEIHYRHAPDYMRGDAPSHECCWLLEGPCWHDGSSLQAEEVWIPLWKAAPHDHDRMFELLISEYEDRFLVKEKS